MSRKRKMASITSAGLVFAMFLSQSAVADLGTEQVKAAEETAKWVDTEYVVNGDFESSINEDGSITGWTKSTGSGLFVTKDQYAKNNTTQFTKINNITGDNSLSQTIKNVEPGTYRISIDQDGQKDVKSGLYVKYLEQAKELPATTDWDNWETVTTDEFTIEAVQDVDICIGGEVTNGYWGDIDNIKLQKLNETKSDDTDSSEENQKGYTISVNKTEVAVENGDTVNLEAKITYDGEEISELPEGVNLWWWVDTWNDHTDGLRDGTLENEKDSGKTLKAAYTTKSAGKYYVVAQLKDADGNELCSVCTTITSKAPEIDTAVDSDLYVDKIKGLSSDFIRGVDISSVVSEYNSGVKYYDFDGNELALTSADGNKTFFDFLKECGVNWVRVRVWNDPKTADGNSYGGGANDLATAKIIGKAATDAGLKVLVDFHYSDFWADPNMQGAPKAWKNMSLEEKVAALSSYTTNSMEELLNAGVDVGMVQIGNETNNGLAGEKPEYNSDTSNSLDLTKMGKLFNAGSKAVKAEASKHNKEILVAIHYTNVQDDGYYESVAKALQNANVDYDVFATSYYPFWHGTTSNLTSVMSSIAKKYDKKVMVAETSYAYTLDDGDGHENNVREGATGLEYNYSVSVQGQANAVADVISAVKAIGDDGIGMFYWEPAWIPVQYAYNDDGSVNSDILASNKSKWEKYGSGWASSYSYEYDPDNAGIYYGGSSWDNQAMFDQNGHPLESINVYKYVLSGTTATAKLEKVPGCTYSVFASSDWSMPTKVQAVYTDNKKYDVDVTWNSSQVEEAKKSGVGTYKIDGTVNANDKIYKVVCTLTIQYPNLLLNNGFEDEDMSMWTVTGEGVGRLADSNKRTGDYSLKFWSADPVDYTASQKVKLNKGKYDLSAYVQGGDAGENPTFQLYMKVNGKTYTADGTVSKWQIWSNPSITGIDVTEDGTEVEIGVITKAAAGAWGAWDDFYLCRTGDASSDADNGNTGDDENKKPDTPSTDDNNKDNTGSGDTTIDKDNGADKDDANKGSTTAPATQPAKVLTPGAVVSSTSDTKTTVKDTKGILPDTVKFESKKVTDEKEVAKVADVVKDKIVGVKDVSIYELNLTDGTTQLHQLADKVQVTMDMPFALADNEAIKVFRVDGDKLIACTSKVIDGKLVFETDHFSTFAFVKVNANAGTKAAPASAAKTSDDSNMYMWLVIAMSGLGVSIAALMNRKKEQA